MPVDNAGGPFTGRACGPVHSLGRGGWQSPRGVMSKHDKAELETGEAGQDYPEREAVASSPSTDDSVLETPESRHFNTWLDRALPLLQQQLSSLGINPVTTPQDKAKH